MKMPKIIEFVKMARKNGHELLDYVDVKELIKYIVKILIFLLDFDNKRAII